LKYAYVLPLAAITVAVLARPEVSQPFEEISNAKISHFTSETNQNEVKNLPEDGYWVAIPSADSLSEFPELQAALNKWMRSWVSFHEPHHIKVDSIFIKGTKKLEIPGDEAALLKWLTENMQQTPVDSIYPFADKMPVFPGGEQALLNWIRDNMVYPTIAMENGFQGNVYCQFVVEKDGSISNVQVTRGVNIYLDQEAKRVLKLLPKFIPGEQKSQVVRTLYAVPVRFKLEAGENENSQPDEVDVVSVPISDSPFSVYPSPANDVLYIDVDQQAMIEKYRVAGKAVSNPSYDIRLYNTSGTLALQTTSGSNRIQLNISNIPDGIYFLHLYDGIDDAPEVKQIVIKH